MNKIKILGFLLCATMIKTPTIKAAQPTIGNISEIGGGFTTIGDEFIPAGADKSKVQAALQFISEHKKALIAAAIATIVASIGTYKFAQLSQQRRNELIIQTVLLPVIMPFMLMRLKNG